MDAEQLCAVVDAIPPGRWMSYGDVCARRAARRGRRSGSTSG